MYACICNECWVAKEPTQKINEMKWNEWMNDQTKVEWMNDGMNEWVVAMFDSMIAA